MCDPTTPEDLATAAAGVAWELARVAEPVRAKQLARLAAENPAFAALVADHLKTLHE